MKNRKKQALDYFISQGLAPHQAAGLVGTLMSESSLVPDTVNASSGAYGLAQWLGSRKDELFKKYGKNPTFEQQLDFIKHELSTTHKNGWKHLLAAQTAQEAADAAFGYYEFMVGPEGAVREMNRYGQNGAASRAQKIKYANGVYDAFFGKNSYKGPNYFGDMKQPQLTGKIVKGADGSLSVVPGEEDFSYLRRAQQTPLTAPVVKQPTSQEPLPGPVIPETTVVGKQPRSNSFRLDIPSLIETQKQNINQWMLKMAGMFPEPTEEDMFYNDINNGMLLIPRIQ